MKNHFFCLISFLLLIVSCGEDNDDFVAAEDVLNIDLDIGITFGVFRNNCTSDCTDIYKWSNTGVFRGQSTGTDFSFAGCPISEQTRFVAQVDGVPNVPRGLRDVENSDLNELISAPDNSFPEVYIIEYTLNSGDTKFISFSSASNDSEQLSTYYSYLINTITSLETLDTTPITCVP